jgi:hypothetical protein
LRTAWSTRIIANVSDPEKWAWCADWLAVAVAVALPWSTSATIILIAFWLATRIPMRDFAAVRREVLSPAGGLPVALWAAGMLGLLWSDAPLAERINGLSLYYTSVIAGPVPLLRARQYPPHGLCRMGAGRIFDFMHDLARGVLGTSAASRLALART